MTRKVLTIKNPWATLILLGIKDVENRSWQTDYRGILQIHSSKKTDDFAHNKIDLCLNLYEKNSTKKEKWISDDSQNLTRKNGYILGEVELVDCVLNHPSIWAERGYYKWVLKNPKIYDVPIEAKGKLRLWEFEKKENE